METIKNNYKGILLSILIATPAFIIGSNFPIIGGPIIAILIGMIMNPFIKDKSKFDNGIRFTSKKILQYAVILLGFGLNLNVVLQTGKQSLPIIISTISTSL
ncbi:MAG: putative sulfate exporter family transporter [Spirochaetia bacterium]|nr:putative sulfate exporter family transporter [Spirochaetia bacterium]